MIETLEWQGEVLARLVRAQVEPARSTFVTAPEESLQLGVVTTPAGGEVARHRHRAVERRVVGTSEVVIVRKGRCLIDLFSPEEELLATWELGTGDVVLLLGGGHGFRMLEDTVLLDVKQGPYAGEDDKHFF